jgi:hypothetical protein
MIVKKFTKPGLFFLLTLILTVNLFTGITPAIAQDAPDREISLVPVPQSPSGTIYSRTPAYTWGVVSGAMEYRFHTYKKGSTTALYTFSIAANTCSVTLCTNTPPTTLDLAGYEWQVQAKVSGAWKAYSSLTIFTVAEGFDSQFNGSINGWGTMGTVTMDVNSKYLSTGGVAGYWAQAYRKTGTFSNFEYTVLMKRLYDKHSANCVFVRMGTGLVKSKNYWNPGYAFCYQGYGMYAIFKRSSTVETKIQGWTLTPAVIIMGWNTLKVVATGTSFKFYINDTFVKSFTDSFRSDGYVGVGMYDSGVARDQLRVDWATLTKLSATFQKANVVSPEQEALNNAALGTGESTLIENNLSD